MFEGSGKHPQSLIVHYLIAILLALLSYLFFASVEAYVVDGEQLLVNPEFSNHLTGWRVRGDRKLVQVDDGIVEIRHDALSQSNSFSQCWDREQFPDRVLFSISASTADLVLGEKPWHKARAGLIGYFPDGEKDYRLSSRLLLLEEDESWKSYRTGVEIDDSLERICISIGLFGSKGLFQFKDPALYPATISPAYSLIKNLLLGVWSIVGVIWLILLIKHYRRRMQMVFMLAMLVAIATGILMPAEVKSVVENWLSPYLPEFSTKQLLDTLGVSLQFPANILPQRWDVSKFGHLLGFFLLSAILFSEKDKSVWILLPGLVIAAVVTEIMQHYVPGRAPRFSDVIVDLIGIVAGWWLIRGYFKIRQSVAG
ncbi:MAG: VanZ family protein [Chromatiales bacterium]|nr:VanZ family protein [Chromatiales bacterium]